MKLEFIKETKPNGEVLYFTEKNGSYIDGSLKYDKDEAYKIYLKLQSKGIESKKEVLETTEL